VLKPGVQVGTAEGRVTDGKGLLLAHGSQHPVRTAPRSLGWRVTTKQVGGGFVNIDELSEIIDAEVCEGRYCLFAWAEDGEAAVSGPRSRSPSPGPRHRVAAGTLQIDPSILSSGTLRSGGPATEPFARRAPSAPRKVGAENEGWCLTPLGPSSRPERTMIETALTDL
jgi:hypothetical protein